MPSQTQQFVKFCRVCQIVGSKLSEAHEPLVDADVVVAYTAEVKRKRADKTIHATQKMDFADFLTSLMKLSVKVYPNNAKRSTDDAFRRLLLSNVLPYAQRRSPAFPDLSEIEASEDVASLRDIFSDALAQIFQFYATGSDAAHGSTSHFASMVSPSRSTRGREDAPHMGTASNSMKNALGYPAFLKFAADFDLSNSVILSTLEIGNVYLSSVRETDPDRHVRKLTFDEFWDALVRCSQVAYTKISSSAPADKLKGLFLYMWRAINRSVPRAVTERRGTSTYAGDLISGAMLFNKRFTALWHDDDYRDYLRPLDPPEETGRAVLRRVMASSGRTAADLTASARVGGYSREPAGPGTAAAASAATYGASMGYDLEDRAAALSGPSAAPGAPLQPSEDADYATGADSRYDHGLGPAGMGEDGGGYASATSASGTGFAGPAAYGRADAIAAARARHAGLEDPSAAAAGMGRGSGGYAADPSAAGPSAPFDWRG